ncbi:MAG: hypothetical protein K2M00_06205, partial [Muribaculaceae bacterium]|nr:hypothetical protein [Muribaculaceae bacterium]
MKKVLLLFALLLGAVGYSSAQEELLYRCQFGDGYNSAKTQTYDASFTVTDAHNETFSWNVENANNNNNQWNFIKIGGKIGDVVGTVSTVNTVPEVITRVKVTIGVITAAKVNSIKFQASKNSDYTGTLYLDETLTTTTGDQEIIIEVDEADVVNATDLYYRLVVDCQKGTSNGLVQLDGIELYGYDPNDSREVVNLSWSMEDLVVLEGEEFEQPVLSAYNGETIELDALNEVKYISNNPAVATVVDGTIKINGAGIATVSAS